jgi:hypothetical protein
MDVFFALVVAHYIGDFPMQGDFLANFKGKNDYILFVHSIIWTGCICAVLGYFGLFAWWKVMALLLGHFIIDRWKARKEDKSTALTRDLWIDQFIHLIQVALVWLL